MTRLWINSISFFLTFSVFSQSQNASWGVEWTNHYSFSGIKTGPSFNYIRPKLNLKSGVLMNLSVYPIQKNFSPSFFLQADLLDRNEMLSKNLEKMEWNNKLGIQYFFGYIQEKYISNELNLMYQLQLKANNGLFGEIGMGMGGIIFSATDYKYNDFSVQPVIQIGLGYAW